VARWQFWVASLVASTLLAACAEMPAPDCEAPPFASGTPTIDCDQAVALAASRLPIDHPGITRIQFGYGDFRPTFFVAPAPVVSGYVVFTFANGPRTAVEVHLSQGQLSAESPAPY
jgi:hypothetical protein